MKVTCKICGASTTFLFTATVLNKYDAQYHYCRNCGFIHVNEPDWLKEAYINPINIEDTGLIKRNVLFAKRTSALLFFLFKSNACFLDFAGGNGLFVRIMRDIGFDFYWSDPYTKNIFARGFEYDNNMKIELITTFESFEHFPEPMSDISMMLSISDNILFSTEIYKGEPPQPFDWDYYSFSHGQHISFYSAKTLKYIAEKFNLNLYTNGKSFHLFTKKKINSSVYNLLLILSLIGLNNLITLFKRSKTTDDSLLAAQLRNHI